jgi:adenine-specific DNA-methyltransferase
MAPDRQLPIPVQGFTVVGRYSSSAVVTLYQGDRLDLLRQIPTNEARLVVTSPPYNIGKRYEKRARLEDYLEGQQRTIEESVRVLAEDGSLCWQVGNHVNGTEVKPLDILIYPICEKLGLRLRNRIVWHFEHGLHCSKRFSGRYETILWFTKSDKYVFNLDAVRIPQKYPGKKYFKGARIGQYSCNPLGKNPGDLWIIPNVKHNHIEKTTHPCQFPIELIQRLVLALTNPGDLVVDPYVGVGSTACAAVLNKRRAAGADIVPEYVNVARQRVELALMGKLQVRPMGRPVYQPDTRTSVARRPPDLDNPHLFPF